MRNPKDDKVHWSDLHEMRKSPAHYAYAVTHPKETTRPMRVGALFDALVFGVRSYAVFDGDRRGKSWEAFQAANAGKELFTASEADDAVPAAKSVLCDPIAAPLIASAKKQIVMHWDIDGVPCAAGIRGERGGFDLLGEDWIRDVKLTNCTEPEQLNRHIVSMGWHEQLVFYRHGARANGIDIRTLGVICVESKPPHTVTVMRLTPGLIELGERSVRGYIEKYKACELSGHWPGYVQCEVEADVPAWMSVAGEGGEDE